MPKRPEIEYVDYFFGFLGKTIKLPLESVKNIEFIQSIEQSFNKKAIQRADRIKEALTPLKLNPLSVEARSYKTLYEGAGLEQVKPRNYVTKEVIEIKAGTLSFIFFIGSYGAPEEAESHIINKVKETYEKRSGQTKTKHRTNRARISLDGASIESVRARFRESKLQRNSTAIR